jgi:hypothetical protein
VQTKRRPKWNICPLTEKGIMKTNKKNFESRILNQASRNSTFHIPHSKKEPGRIIAGKYVPNRIIRGRVVELLRDSKTPLTLESIGREVCIDWSPEEHRDWLEKIVAKLIKDALLSRRGSTYMLKME